MSGAKNSKEHVRLFFLKNSLKGWYINLSNDLSMLGERGIKLQLEKPNIWYF